MKDYVSMAGLIKLAYERYADLQAGGILSGQSSFDGKDEGKTNGSEDESPLPSDPGLV